MGCETLLTAALSPAKGSTNFSSYGTGPKDFRTVAKPELGTKRLCAGCGAKFYDLNKDPITCPKCGTVFEVAVPVSRGRGEAASAAAAAAAAAAASRAPAKEAETELPESADVEMVTLEDADAESSGPHHRPREPRSQPRPEQTGVEASNGLGEQSPLLTERKRGFGRRRVPPVDEGAARHLHGAVEQAFRRGIEP